MSTVRERGWTGWTDQTIADKSQGQVDAFLPIDRGFEFEHYLREFTFGIVIAHPQSNQMPAYEMLWDVLMTALTEVRPTQVIHAYPREARTLEQDR